uniref:RNA-directed DNA polymerase, eukaryota, reverse transcriptase zinc-binding domain protein n=1 Tax=Tanacetum cinerariifolium TaxID=118510 RepID=A0A6L2KNB9_TANCI|nr:hypothetical protein [Tanacetum cinerariifolium]
MGVQRLLDADPNNRSMRERSIIIGKEYSTNAEDELKLLHQKARVNWLKEGGKNSAYFHSILRTRKNKSRVETICKEDGTRVDGTDVSEQFVNHFKNFLGKSQPIHPLSNMEEYVQAKLSDEEALDIIKMMTNKEIKVALFDIDSSKVAGYNRKNGAKRCAMKTDVQKAYDTVNWDFLKSTLQLVGFMRDKDSLGVVKKSLEDFSNPSATVLSTIQHYWASVYMLPMSVINDLEKMFKRFLWNSGSSAQGKARVAWKIVSLEDLRRKGVFRVFMWYDNWNNLSPLDRVIPKNDRNAARMKDNETVVDLVQNGSWEWPDEWLQLYPLLNQVVVLNFSMRKDSVVWIGERNNEVEY